MGASMFEFALQTCFSQRDVHRGEAKRQSFMLERRDLGAAVYSEDSEFDAQCVRLQLVCIVFMKIVKFVHPMALAEAMVSVVLWRSLLIGAIIIMCQQVFEWDWLACTVQHARCEAMTAEAQRME